MESYEVFCRTQVLHVKIRALQQTHNNEALQPLSLCGSSFMKVPILPPLLTKERKAEMLKYKDEALKVENKRRNLPRELRMSRVRALLDSVQLRKAPTLEEFIQTEVPDLFRESTEGQCKDIQLEDNTDIQIDSSLPCTPTAKPDHQENVDATAEDTCSAKSSEVCHSTCTIQGMGEKAVCQNLLSDLVQSPETCSTLANDIQVYKCPESHQNMSQRSVSSGYLTYDNVDLSGNVNSGMEHFLLSKDEHAVPQDGFFLHPRTCVTSKIPDSIGEFKISSQDLQEESTAGAQNIVLKPAELENARIEKPSDPGLEEKPHHISLQSMLKMSQEYRKKQKQLRSMKARASENCRPDSLSDKENEEFSWPLRDESKKGNRIKLIPRPRFCKSPVHSVNFKCHSRKKQFVNMSVSISDNPDSNKKIDSDAPEADQVMKSRNHTLTQLEMNLSSLTAFISAVESTITEISGASTPDTKNTLTVKDDKGSFARWTLEPSKIPVRCKTESTFIKRKTETTPQCHSVNRSCDDESSTGRECWGLHSGPERDPLKKALTLKSENNGQESRARRRLLMNAPLLNTRRDSGVTDQRSTTLNARLSVLGIQQQVRREHAGGICALLEEQQKAQQNMMQKIAAQCQQLSFQSPNCSQDQGVTTFPPAPWSPLIELTVPPRTAAQDARPSPRLSIIAATVSGYLNRRLLRTERVMQLVRIVKDTQQFLLAFQPQTPGRAEFTCTQDRALHKQVLLQLRSARYEVHDIFFNCSPAVKMQLISRDRELVRERNLQHVISRHRELAREKDLKYKGRCGKASRGRRSPATKKPLEGKRGLLIQKGAAESPRVLGNIQPGTRSRKHPCKEQRAPTKL
ncbi:centriolar coiled-coil protein of 110 kDa [Amia ocellicauda]|uniref:centriolar coiled-coil protein of 110 kDa n=1 Tax=Amia ocellicauda TaxID=2972642 RepID=UPI003463EF81